MGFHKSPTPVVTVGPVGPGGTPTYAQARQQQPDTLPPNYAYPTLQTVLNYRDAHHDSLPPGISDDVKTIEDTQRLPTAEEIIYSPFVQDTLMSLTGGPPSSIKYQDAITLPLLEAVKRRIFSPRSADFKNPIFGSVRSKDLSMRLRNDAQENTITHEFGHLADFRNSIPGFDDVVDRDWSAIKNRRVEDNYERVNKEEYSAELFTNALDVIRGSKNSEDLRQHTAQLRSRFPGIQEAVGLILTQPIYAQHPLAREQQERLFRAMGIVTRR